MTAAPADPVGVRWRRWAAMLVGPAIVVGVLAYPDVQTATMPLPLALGIVLIVAAVIVMSGRFRLMILLPIVSAFLPSPEIGFASYLLVLGYFLADCFDLRLARRLDGFDWGLLAVLLWSVMSWLANLGDQTDAWSLPVFALTFLTPWMLIFLARAAAWTAGEVRLVVGVFLALVAAQLGPALLKPLAMGMPAAYSVPLLPLQLTRIGLLRQILTGDAADITTGTTPSAHHLGIVLLLAGVLLVALSVAVRRRFALPLLAGILFVFLMTDSKHVILAAVPSGIVFAWLVLWPALGPRARRYARMLGLVLAVTAGPYLAARIGSVLVGGLWEPYVVLAKVNPKVQLVLRTGRLLARDDANTWIGFGPGAYASRAASIRATDILFKEENRLPSLIPPHSSPAYRSVAYDLYTSAIVGTARFRSGVLTNPFSSVIGIVGEYGIGGTLVVGFMLLALTRAGYRRWKDATLDPVLRAAGATVGFAVPFIVVVSVFDSYFEQPDVMATIAVLAVLTLAAPPAHRAVTAAG